MELSIAATEVSDPAVRALLKTHLGFSYGVTPPDEVYALPLDSYSDPRVTLFAARVLGEVVGVGALRELDNDHVEIKSMHTAAAARGRGIARAMLEHLLLVARSRENIRVSLETGTMSAYAAARSLYENAGFKVCAPFGDYRASEGSVCMTLLL